MGEEDMSIPTKLILSLAAALGGGITKKYYTDQESTKLSGGFWFNAVSCLTAAVVLLCWGGFGSASAVYRRERKAEQEHKADLASDWNYGNKRCLRSCKQQI